MSRTGEILGIGKLVLPDPKVLKSKEFQSVSVTSEKWLDIAFVDQQNLRAWLLDRKSEGYILCGAEQVT